VATTVAEAEQVVPRATRARRKLVVGYILRHHPSWLKFIELAQSLGTPLVMRMNLNQQSAGPQWRTHKQLLQVDVADWSTAACTTSTSCGLMTPLAAVRVSAIGARLGRRHRPRSCTTTASSGGVRRRVGGWYEAGWGPMMSGAPRSS